VTADRDTTRPVPLLRNRDYVIRFAGGIVSTLGTRISGVAFPLVVLALTHSALQVGVVSALGNLPPLVVGLPAGVLVDRWDRKKVAIVCDSIRGLNLASVAAVLALGHLTIEQLYVNSLADGVASVLFFTAIQASTRRIVPPQQLAQNARYDQIAVFTLGTLGPPLGGILYGIGEAVPFLADAISYAASVVSLLFVRAEFQLERPVERRNFLKEVHEGLAWVWRHGTLRSLLVASTLFQAARTGTLLVLIVLSRRAGATPFEVGAILALMGIGGVIGALLSHPIQKTFTIGQISIGVVWVYALLYPLLAVVPNPLLFGVIAAAWSVALPAMLVVQGAYRQLLVPDPVQGRVASIARIAAWSAQSAGAALAGMLLQSVGGRGTIAAGFLALVAVGVIMVRAPDIRRAPHLANVSAS